MQRGETLEHRYPHQAPPQNRNDLIHSKESSHYSLKVKYTRAEDLCTQTGPSTEQGHCGERNLISVSIGPACTGAAEITPTFRKITVGSPKQLVGCGPFR
jgi:hypothetical protein